jgi:hypothetical protein
MSRLAVGLAASVLLAGCNRQETGAGRIEVSWTGSDTGRIAAPAVAHWCASDSTLEITGIEADSGAALALFPADTVIAGRYPVGSPTRDLTRPRAGVALRRFGENMVLGYYSRSGVVSLDSLDPYAGTVEATLQNLSSGEQVTLSGGFHGIRLSADSSCRSRPDSNPPDSGIR